VDLYSEVVQTFYNWAQSDASIIMGNSGY